MNDLEYFKTVFLLFDVSLIFSTILESYLGLGWCHIFLVYFPLASTELGTHQALNTRLPN